MTETPKDRYEAIEMIARVAIEYPWRVKAFIEAAEKLGLRLVPRGGARPFPCYGESLRASARQRDHRGQGRPRESSGIHRRQGFSRSL